MTGNFTGEERRRLLEHARTDRALFCPRCDLALTVREVPPDGRVAYVRDRLWFVCEGCKRSLVLDRPAGWTR